MELDQYPEDRTEKIWSDMWRPPSEVTWSTFSNAIASRGKPVVDIEQGHISTASCILANMSMELGRALSWDAQKGEILKDAEANQKLARAYRSPWKLSI